jgi:hypothetical protein
VDSISGEIYRYNQPHNDATTIPGTVGKRTNSATRSADQGRVHCKDPLGATEEAGVGSCMSSNSGRNNYERSKNSVKRVKK